MTRPVTVLVVAPVVVALRPPGVAVTVYLVIAEPPLLLGALQVTTTAPLPAAPDTLVGACGTVAVGVTALLAAEDGDVPAALVAVTVKVYALPSVRPMTVAVVFAALTRTLAPPGLAVTV